jgi:hypothetical protein
MVDPADLSHVRWFSTCRPLDQLPLAADSESETDILIRTDIMPVGTENVV